eukprot:4687165-Pyramimonas_sp.AAC.1
MAPAATWEKKRPGKAIGQTRGATAKGHHAIHTLVQRVQSTRQAGDCEPLTRFAEDGALRAMKPVRLAKGTLVDCDLQFPAQRANRLESQHNAL